MEKRQWSLLNLPFSAGFVYPEQREFFILCPSHFDLQSSTV